MSSADLKTYCERAYRALLAESQDAPDSAERAHRAVLHRVVQRLLDAHPFGASVSNPFEAPELGSLALTEPPVPDDAAAGLGLTHETLLGLRSRRRTQGAHYTDPALADAVIARALTRPHLPTRVLDPAMGSGVFLVRAAAHLVRTTGASAAEVVGQCLFGFDLDPIAVALARVALGLLAQGDLDAQRLLTEHVREGDFLETKALSSHFDAVIGNPPWVAYMGRAAEPLPTDKKRHFRRRFSSYAGYPTLHGLFVERATEVLSPGGRLGFLLPTSVADLEGYRPTRKAHDARALVDPRLPDFGPSAFVGVFQPSMALLSTRRSADVEADGSEWALEGQEDPSARAILDRLQLGPRIAKERFGERGYQTTPGDRAVLQRRPHDGATPLRCGGDIGPYQLFAPSYFAVRERLQSRLASEAAFGEVAVLIRQTARFPIAVVSDGLAFRNSILAGYGSHPEGLAAYLNANLIRYFHFHRFRDARQGMPQLKVGHLRQLPAPPKGLLSLLEALATAASRDPIARENAVDRAVFAAFEIEEPLVRAVLEWAAAEGRVPARRARKKK